MALLASGQPTTTASQEHGVSRLTMGLEVTGKEVIVILHDAPK